MWGPYDIDLFASCLNKQLRTYISWKPDPNALAIDAFSINWQNRQFYAFPPFSLIGRVLQEIKADLAEGTIIIPLWPSQHWFAKILNMTIDMPRMLPKQLNVMALPEDQSKKHPLHNNLQLLACQVSGIDSKVWAFQETLQTYCLHPGEIHHKSNIALIITNGSNSVPIKKLIHFIPL